MLSWFPLFFPFRVSDLRPIGICAWRRLLDGQDFPHRRGAVLPACLSRAIVQFPLTRPPTHHPPQEPLYLPSNSELHVSIWRLTNTKQVWYEWHAEAFLAVQAMAPPGQWQGASRSSTLGLLSPSPSAFDIPVPASPLIDAVDMPPFGSPSEVPATPVRESSIFRARAEPLTMIKIGQTNLHNPGGRSSWIGL